jgi:peroxiredoxin
MAIASDSVVLRSPAGDFQLRGTDERIYSFDDVAGERGTVIVFICNHCPYVKAVIDRVVQDALALQDDGVGFAAICSNDTTAYPEDSFENMKAFGRDHGLPFPYLHDEDQSAALTMERSVRRTSSDTIEREGSGTMGAWTRAARTSPPRQPRGNSSRPCERWRQPA